MIAADAIDATVITAFGVGFISFISPCVLPLVPGYLSTISGVSFAEIQDGKGRAKVLGPAVLFCLSFTVMFVALGMTATGVGTFFQDNRRLLQQMGDRRGPDALAGDVDDRRHGQRYRDRRPVPAHAHRGTLLDVPALGDLGQVIRLADHALRRHH